LSFHSRGQESHEQPSLLFMQMRAEGIYNQASNERLNFYNVQPFTHHYSQRCGMVERKGER
jgi:hypothetical protein